MPIERRFEAVPVVSRGAPKPLRLVATCSPGLEELLERELVDLGVGAVERTRSAVRFRGDWPDVWRANYWLRTANRVLVELATFPASTSEELYGGAAALVLAAPRRSDDGAARARGVEARGRAERSQRRSPQRSASVGGVRRGGADLAGVGLTDLLSPARTFAVSATATSSRLRDTRWIALKVKDAIVDAQRVRFGRRADVDVRRPDLPLRVWVRDDRATLLLDSSREPLDRRGYRRVSGAAPLREQLAAACVLASGWDGRGPVVDPMCGTGTLLVEAAWIALGRAPGALRPEWVFEKWPGFDAAVFARVRAAHRHGRAPTVSLAGRDLSRDAIRASRANLEAAGVDAIADLEVGDAFAFEPPAEPGLLVLNPAYGERLETSDAEWRRLGDLLKQRYSGWRCAVIAGAPSFGKHIGLRPRRRIPVRNGPLDARILLFDLYRGRAKDAPPPDSQTEKRYEA